MNFLRTATFGGLFGVTFTVSAAFQVACTLLMLIPVVLAPNMFTMNGAPAGNPGQALGVLVFLLGVGLAMNAAISALGSGVWLLARKALKPVAA
ncbi:MAG: hypothetical protein QM608_11910 [Caulobacter sp.]